ncbi:MAG: sulfatase-like hydrolase/transferase, partial [Bryobacterales bacterium]|nr:sulfatase-like hydrolase/transferase [Bryobacterales bacterium]
ATPRSPNIVLILADDLGYGDLGCFGGKIPTPHLDRLAATGIRFTSAYTAAPICSPSRAGLITGQYPARHGIFSYIDSRARQKALGMKDWLDPQAPSLARALRSAGYATGHFGKWHLGGGRDIGDAPLPAEYGFDESYTSFEGLGDRVLPPGRLADMSEKLGRGDITRAPKSELTQRFVDRAIRFAERNQSRPFYIQLWPDDVHDPFQPSPSQLSKFAHYSENKYHQQYFAVLDEMDRQIGRLVARIEDLGLRENTLFVFLSDNGPTAWPHYYKEQLDPPGSTAGLRGRKWSLYEGGIRTPLLVSWKGRIPEGKTDRETVCGAVDFFPSLCRLANARLPAAPFDGEDLSQAFLGKPQRRKKDLFWEYGRTATGFPYPGLEHDRSPNLAIRSGRWKLLQNADGTRVELYDFAASDRERENVAAQEPGVTRRLSERLLRWRRSLPA